MATVLAHHCRSKEREDMDVVLEHGIARALFRALDQLANSAQHPELAWSKVVLFGSSRAGSLVARLIRYMPEKVLPESSTRQVNMTLWEWTLSIFQKKRSFFPN